MFSFDKLVLLLISLICMACVMYIGLQTGPATANETMILGSLMGFLGLAQGFLFSVLKADAQAQSRQPVAAPVIAAPVAEPAPPVAQPAPPAGS